MKFHTDREAGTLLHADEYGKTTLGVLMACWDGYYHAAILREKSKDRAHSGVFGAESSSRHTCHSVFDNGVAIGRMAAFAFILRMLTGRYIGDKSYEVKEIIDMAEMSANS